jgi:hypothetical protein
MHTIGNCNEHMHMGFPGLVSLVLDPLAVTTEGVLQYWSTPDCLFGSPYPSRHDECKGQILAEIHLTGPAVSKKGYISALPSPLSLSSLPCCIPLFLPRSVFHFYLLPLIHACS